jgi:hypothetical protein
MVHDKDGVHAMLSRYRDDLAAALADPTCLAELDAAARRARRQRAAGSPGNIPWENTLVGRLLVPVLHSTVARDLREDPKAVQHIIHSENVASRTKHASPFSPARTLGHPFGKTVGASIDGVAKAWRTTDKKNTGLASACPDFALGHPYNVVFEAKYYRPTTGTLDVARRALVSGIYQAFFYRSLPFAPARKKDGPAWDYDYAGFVAVDISPGRALHAAWEELRANVKASFWNSANIFVIVVPAPGS